MTIKAQSGPGAEPDLRAAAPEHDCLDRSGVIWCCEISTDLTGCPWSGPVTEAEVAALAHGQDLRQCRICGRRFAKRCNFEDDFS